AIPWEGENGTDRLILGTCSRSDSSFSDMDLESQYERYDLSLAAVAEGPQDQFDPVDYADEFHIATFFPGVPMRGLMHYPPVVDFAQVSAVQRRLKKVLQRGSALEDLVAVALVLLRHMHAYDVSEESWAEYKNFVRQEDARFNAASQVAGALDPIEDPIGWRPAW
ncbi:unnamed protein product, partial [Aphanomyces euteiches]